VNGVNDASVNEAASRHNAIAHAAEVLAAGQLVAFPTETVYGLGADADDPTAVARLYAAKGRPANHPVIVHLAAAADPLAWASTLPPAAQRLIDAYWPGPLTLILPRRAGVGEAVSGGQDSIGLRCPSHPVAQALLQAFADCKARARAGVAAPSANVFGHVSPTCAAHVRAEFPAAVAAGMPVLQGGAAHIGIESTIVDLSRWAQGAGAVLLRPGHISAAEIAAVLGQPVQPPDATAPRASGTLKAHYAPRTPLVLLDAAALRRQIARPPAGRIAVVVYDGSDKRQPPASSVATDTLVWHAIAADPARYAQALYALLRELDSQGYDHIWLQAPPTSAAWDAVNDRLKRAAAAFETVTPVHTSTTPGVR